MYVALVTPYEVGFVEPSNQIDGLFITNRMSIWSSSSTACCSSS